VLYFFTIVLARCIGDMSHHVCETDDLKVCGNTRNPKTLGTIVQKLGKNTFVAPLDRANSMDDDEYDPNEMLLEDLATEKAEGFVNVDPFRMLVAKCGKCVCTLWPSLWVCCLVLLKLVFVIGCVYQLASGEYQRKVFDVLYIIPLKNFDLLGMIQNTVLVPPPANSQNYTSEMKRFEELNSIWISIQSVEASNNLGLHGFGSVQQFNYDPFGPLGAARLNSPFKVPIKIVECIKKAGGKAEGRQMHGLPKGFDMSRGSVVFQQYRDYETAYLMAAKSRLFKLREEIARFKKKRGTKKKEQGSDEEEDEASEQAVCFACPGGWPCERVSFVSLLC
jgi:hypothetical protein